MGDKTGIGWTDATWTVVTGCSRVSPGCGGPGPHGGCYAEILSARKLAGLPHYKGVAHVVGGKDDGSKIIGGEPRWTGLVRTHPDRLDQPLRWKRPRRIFANSMSDTFHADVPNEFIAAIFGIAAACPQHSFQFLTKRAERLPEWFAWVERNKAAFDGSVSRYCRAVAAGMLGELRGPFGRALDPAHRLANGYNEWPLPNVAIGVSAEDQQRADERIPLLLQVPNACPWVSVEPMLGPIDLRPYLDGGTTECSPRWCSHPFLRHVVIGGESGPRHRPMDVSWLRYLVTQCRDAGVPVFVKQSSGLRPGKQGSIPDDLWALKQLPEGQ